nr:sugar transferase [uncultured Brumimicrobium sp.]
MLKRAFDIVSSVFGLLLLSPVFIIVVIWIKLDSKGPVFYKQVRVGKNNIDFKILKFRSMRQDADKGSLITIGGRDPRVTQSGYYIRKYKLDELPQLINVLKGDMSIVGPRPEVRRYVDLYTEEQKRVLSVQPGITDIASIKYRNENELLENAVDPDKIYIESIMPDKLKHNLEYIDKQSFLFDLKLIAQTIKEIIIN